MRRPEISFQLTAGAGRGPLYQKKDEGKETSMADRIRELEKENSRLISENEMLKARM